MLISQMETVQQHVKANTLKLDALLTWRRDLFDFKRRGLRKIRTFSRYSGFYRST